MSWEIFAKYIPADRLVSRIYRKTQNSKIIKQMTHYFFLNRHFTKEKIQMTNKNVIKCSTLLVIRECKLKPQRDTKTHVLKWLKFLKRPLIIADAGKQIKQQ